MGRINDEQRPVLGCPDECESFAGNVARRRVTSPYGGGAFFGLQGYDVTGVYMKTVEDLPGMHCPWAEDDVVDAKRACYSALIFEFLISRKNISKRCRLYDS